MDFRGLSSPGVGSCDGSLVDDRSKGTGVLYHPEILVLSASA